MDITKYLIDLKERVGEKPYQVITDLIVKMERKNMFCGIGEVEMSRICKGFIVGYELGKAERK